MFGPWNKKYEPTQEVWRFFIPKPREYPSAARSVKSSNPYRPACQWYALTQNGSPGKKAQENIIVPAATLAAAAERKNKKTEIKEALGEFVWRETKRRPMIIPIIMEV